MLYRLFFCCWLLVGFDVAAQPIPCDKLTERVEQIKALLRAGEYAEVTNLVATTEQQYSACQVLLANAFHEMYRANLSAARKLNWKKGDYLKIFDKAKSNLLLLKTKVAISTFEITLQEIDYLIFKKQLDNALSKALSTLAKYDKIAETHQQVHKVHAQLARIYIYRSELSHAIESSITAISLIKQFDPNNHIHIGWLYNNLGAIYYHLRQFSKAKETFIATEKQWLLSYDHDHENFANIYANLASVEKKIANGDLQQALIMEERAFEIYKKYYPSDHPRILSLVSNLAVTSWQMSNNQKAAQYFQLFAENYDVENSRFSESGHHGSYISFLTEQGRINDALAWFGKVEELTKTRNASYKMLFSGIDSFIKFYTKTNQLLLALQWAEFRREKTVEFVNTISQDDALTIPFFGNENQREFLVFVSDLHLKVQQVENTKLLERSEDNLLKALSLFTANKATKNQRLQLAFSKGEEEKGKAQLLAKKSRLLQSVSQANVNVEQLRLLKASLSKINNKLKLIDASVSVNAGSLVSLSAKALQKRVRKAQSVVYFMQSKYRINAVVIDQDKITVVNLKDIEQGTLEGKVIALRDSVRQASVDYIFQLKEFNVAKAIELYEHLISPLPLKPHVTFVQTPLVEQIPLATLINKNAISGHQYLAQAYQISFIPSLLSLDGERSQDTHLYHSLAFGSPSLNNSNSGKRLAPKITLSDDKKKNIDIISMLPSLPYTDEEIAFFSKSLQNNRVYTKEQATEREVKKQINSNNYIISFATHALSVEYPSGKTLSALVLTPDQDTENIDEGLLTTEDIESMDINAQLVVLSACNTAFSEDGASNDLSGLASSFIFAGTKNVLVSTAQIDDKATAQLMTEFYANVDSGFSKALMQGMNAMIKSKDYSHPYYWANFRLIGAE